MKTLKKVPIVPIVLGTLLLAYALVSWFVDKSPFTLNGQIAQGIIGAGLIAFAVFITLPKLDKKGSKLGTTLRAIEFVIIILAAIVGFIVPIFTEASSIGTGSLWFGIALLLNGGVELYLGSHGKSSNRGLHFFINLASVIFGTYIYAKNLVDNNLRLATFILLLATSIVLLLVGFVNLTIQKKSKAK